MMYMLFPIYFHYRNFIAGCDNLLVENSTNNFFSSFMKPVISSYTSKKDSVLNLSDGTFIEEVKSLFKYSGY